ncbi:MAG: hypothetical protein A2289_15050 [Deltaproteobacteria bacterium RIFOXYA12_FULL_58_15]|nr:MAG: hypothetical protein A2289_15050 [Deltaproteobacteria bacterium RIFOXYA12_FULL_58_15]OGR13042.1 MAG: hypothetical protein A2341_08260 [Deltaproteobacteria bacterium RIFOXYB12_FULL_58_9]
MLTSTAWGQTQDPAVETDPGAVAETTREDLKEKAMEQGLSREIVEKLSPAQIVDVLKAQEVFRGDERVLPEDVVQKLGPEQLAEVLKAREKRKSDSSLEDVLVPTLVSLSFFLCLAFLVGLPLFLRFREHTQRQETLRLMVEKGTQIPPELLAPPTPQRSDLRKGIVLVAAGLSIVAFLAIMGEGPAGAWSIGLIPTLIGGGYLLAWKLEPNGRNDNS